MATASGVTQRGQHFCPVRGILGNSASTSLAACTEPLARRFGVAMAVGGVLWLAFLSLAVVFAPPWLTALGLVAAFGSVVALCVATRGMATTRNLSQLSGTLGMYELEEPIAQGGMGEVWHAKHQLLTRPAAIKLIKPHPNGSGELEVDALAIKRFEREAQVTASLRSPHTVELYDFGVTRTGTFYYVMELLEGTDLEELVRVRGPLEPARVVHILEQVLDSLAEAHARGLVHRDIKPANLYLSERGLEKDFVKVLDFGLVKLDGDGGNRSLSRADRVTGTPAYLAPEIITGHGKVDGRADIYALGCVAYWLLTGKTLFEASSAMQMAIAHVTATPVPPSQRVGLPIPAGLERIVMACLEKEPERRPKSAVAMLEMLRALRANGDDAELPRAEPPPKTAPRTMN